MRASPADDIMLCRIYTYSVGDGPLYSCGDARTRQVGGVQIPAALQSPRTHIFISKHCHVEQKALALHNRGLNVARHKRCEAQALLHARLRKRLSKCDPRLYRRRGCPISFILGMNGGTGGTAP